MTRSQIALLVLVATVALYVVTAGNLVEYDAETAAVSEGLVKTGQLRVLPGTRLTKQGIGGRLGYKYSRTGLTQPILEAPFYWVGEKLDRASSGGSRYSWRNTFLRLFNPLMAALTIVGIFALLTLRGASDRDALRVAALAAVASLIWPYSKIGMDTTAMAMLAATILAAVWAARSPTPARFALLGLAAALTVNAKPYGAVLLIGVTALLIRPVQELARKRRARVAVALGVPLLIGFVAVGWYNWYRTGSVTNFNNFYVSELLAMPINAVGLFVSPGKGLLLYSPLVAFGLLGVRVVLRADRPLALMIALTVVLNTIVIAASAQWGDETWGPRYLLPSAWLLLLPLAWWPKNRRQRRWLHAVAVLSVVVQFAGVLPRYYVSATAAQALAREPVYSVSAPQVPVAYGDDGPRWIPEASPLLFQLELLAAYTKEQLLGSGFVVSYTPFRGNVGTIDLRHPEHTFGPLPDFWWNAPGEAAASKVLAAVLAISALGAGVLLIRRARDAPRPEHRNPRHSPESRSEAS